MSEHSGIPGRSRLDGIDYECKTVRPQHTAVEVSSDRGVENGEIFETVTTVIADWSAGLLASRSHVSDPPHGVCIRARTAEPFDRRSFLNQWKFTLRDFPPSAPAASTQRA